MQQSLSCLETSLYHLLIVKCIWVGVIAFQGLAIYKRLAKVKGVMFKMKAIIEDFQMQAIGEMAGAWDIWGRAIIPSLLANCGSWAGIGSKTYKILNDLQNMSQNDIFLPPFNPPAIIKKPGWYVGL